MERIRVGNVEVVALVDSGFDFPPDRVYHRAGEAIERYRHYLNAAGQVSMADVCFLLRADGRTLLVDTGLGPSAAGRLMDELAAAGVAPGDIDAVTFTHLHGDHTGWNLDPETGRPRFPAARYLVPRGDWDHYSQQQGGSFGRDVEPLEALGCLDLIEGGHALAPSVVALATPGHTPGHLSFAIDSGGERALILGDVVLSPIDTEEPDWPNTFDSDDDVARATRHRVLDRLEQSGEIVGAAHLPAPGIGRIVRVDGRRTWRAGT